MTAQTALFGPAGPAAIDADIATIKGVANLTRAPIKRLTDFEIHLGLGFADVDYDASGIPTLR
jgi:hypothetical protein